MLFLPHLFRLPSRLHRRARRTRLRLMIALFVLSCLLLTPLYWIYKPPSFVISYFQHRWPDVLFRVNTSKKIIALTIDDAPSEYTREILEILKDNDAAATFFTIGSQIEGREDILRDIVLQGNELGNHAMYDEPSRSLSEGTLVEQIHIVEEKIQKAYKAAGSKWETKYFRPGSGFFSSKMRETVRKLGYKLVLGNVYPHDPQISYWWMNAAHILSMVRPGAVVICHDRRSWTVPMLRKVLPELKRRGYRIVTVTELLKQGG